MLFLECHSCGGAREGSTPGRSATIPAGGFLSWDLAAVCSGVGTPLHHAQGAEWLPKGFAAPRCRSKDSRHHRPAAERPEARGENRGRMGGSDQAWVAASVPSRSVRRETEDFCRTLGGSRGDHSRARSRGDDARGDDHVCPILRSFYRINSLLPALPSRNPFLPNLRFTRNDCRESL